MTELAMDLTVQCNKYKIYLTESEKQGRKTVKLAMQVACIPINVEYEDEITFDDLILDGNIKLYLSDLY
jgi:hypothetical protein